MDTSRINLTTTDNETHPIPVPSDAKSVSIQVVVGTAGWGATTSVVSMQWSNGKTDDNLQLWSPMIPAVTFDSSTPSRRQLPAWGMKMIRVACTTSQSDADPIAVVLAEFFT